MDDADEVLIGDGPVLVSLRNGIAELVLNRPDAANGMTVEFLSALYKAIMKIHGDSRVRVVILRGNGKHFCAGGDVKVFASKGEKLPDYLREATSLLQIVAGALIRLNAPVIASVHGFAAGGGGFGLVCASDFVVAGKSAKFLTGATRAGMAPDAGASVTLQRLVGFRKAMELLLRNTVLSASEAQDLGIINTVVDDENLDAETRALAEELARGAPLALAATKRLLWNGVGTGVEACLPEESRTVAELSGTYDAREALDAVMLRRDPEFEGR
ncbi:enoyl-CoA hydratase/isomerase family protein [Henriciella barbarensis]|uniref:Enoyl-CoA hydratase/isomerase family protein n=1 Tax=Henriciella barbarensis TaxID=86342 RepID=A0A399R1K7_9PROT|nr:MULTISPECIES: enoyl-CoA hydratase-related protein [Henriciella]RIJ24651.1 enoyl-CoA hydratase/isomerase family protein [Henriciella barbarensis]